MAYLIQLIKTWRALLAVARRSSHSPRLTWRRRAKEGQMLIELLLAVGLAAVILPALVTGFVSSKDSRVQQSQRADAVAFLQETKTALRSVREAGWSNLSINGTYHPVISGNIWTLAAGSETVNGLTRQIVISDASRDNTGAITTSGGTIDPSTKKVDFTVSWTQPRSSSLTSTMYFTRYLGNLTYTQTTDTVFNQGTLSNVSVTKTYDGEVTLGAGGGGGNWCIPTQSITAVDLSRQGVPTSIAAVQGKIYTATGGNASGPTFAETNVSGNSPPVATISGTFNNTKANGVYGDAGNYAYITTTNHSQEIIILDMTQFTDPPTNSQFKNVGYFDAPGNTQGNAVYVSGTVGYMTAGSKFYTFDLSSQTGSRPRLGSYTLTLAGNGNKIVVVGNYAYVATDSLTSQVQIIDVSNPSSPSIAASINTGNGLSGVDVAVNSNGTRAYVVTTYTAGKQDFFVVDVSTKSGILSPIGTGYSTNGMTPTGVAIGTGNRVMIVGTGGTQQYQVIVLDNELAPASCAGLAITNGAYGIATVLQNDTYAYSYIVTGDTNAELKIILGGAGNQFTTTGTFTSSAFDAGYNASFNRISYTAGIPNATTLKLQVAVAPAVNGSCTGATYSFVGSDGTANTYYTSSPGSIPFLLSGSYTNPGRCLKYKAYLTTSDSSQSPVLDDVTINYSP